MCVNTIWWPLYFHFSYCNVTADRAASVSYCNVYILLHCFMLKRSSSSAQHHHVSAYTFALFNMSNVSSESGSSEKRERERERERETERERQREREREKERERKRVREREMLNAVSQIQTNESECERRRAIDQRAGSCFIGDSVSRIADE